MNGRLNFVCLFYFTGQKSAWEDTKNTTRKRKCKYSVWIKGAWSYAKRNIFHSNILYIKMSTFWERWRGCGYGLQTNSWNFCSQHFTHFLFQISPDIDLSQLAGETEGFSGSDLRELCRNACVYIVRDYMRSNNITDE